ncbi:MAG: hypothetical protein FJ388_00490, partial [Verrucomicrobia bacterium]|nr:hypothetical protein [Verrucomicrobiota bacterium]
MTTELAIEIPARSAAVPGARVKLLFGATIFLSAFLLFQVQPMIAKIILPWFGGTAAVWTTCMVFFQVGLLAGYLYAHALTRFLNPHGQFWLHAALLMVSLVTLPLAPSPALKPTGTEEPTLRILLLLAVSVGLPYFLLSSTGPLVQAWLARAWAGTVPYRLFALSNAGSMLALLTYPTLVEPWLPVGAQTRIWSAAFAAFAALCAASGFVTRKATGSAAPASEEVAVPRPTVSDWLLWLLLPACGSILLLAVTNHLTQNVAPVPFLWVLPLSLYLLSFIICFDRDCWYRRWWSLPVGVAAIGTMAMALSPDQENMAIKRAVPMFNAALFVCCMICHGELARLKPRSQHLTSFYLMVAAGGAVGGLFVGIAAPRVFSSFWEMHVGLVLCAVLALAVLWRASKGLWQK